MCMASKGVKLVGKLHDKITEKHPLMRKIEEQTGYRPFGLPGVLDELGIQKRRKNRWRQPGGKGNPNTEAASVYRAPAHAKSIAARRAQGG